MNSVNKFNYDYIITGQGIGGTLLAYFLHKKGCKILLVDDGHKTASSLSAGGVMNPVTGRKFQNSWEIDTLLPFAKETYKKLEKLLACKFLYEIPLMKIFSENKEINDWSALAGDEKINPYLKNNEIELLPEDKFNNPLGGFWVEGAAYLDMSSLIFAFKEKFKDKINFIKEKFKYKDLIVTPEYIQWKGIRTKRIVFCEGYKVIFNPFFNYLPYAPAKGELLIIRSNELYDDRIIHKGVGIMPLKDGTYKVGATYNWDQMDQEATKEAREFLIEKLEKIFKGNYEIIGQLAGVRPAMQDHRPVLGCHPNHKNVCIFNGLGSKGVLLAPYFAYQLAEHFENKGKLQEEVDIKRYY